MWKEAIEGGQLRNCKTADIAIFFELAATSCKVSATITTYTFLLHRPSTISLHVGREAQ